MRDQERRNKRMKEGKRMEYRQREKEIGKDNQEDERRKRDGVKIKRRRKWKKGNQEDERRKKDME